MTSTKCKECKKEVSVLTKTCPHCGVTHPAMDGKVMAILKTIILIAVSLWFISWLISDEEVSDKGKNKVVSQPEKEHPTIIALRNATNLCFLFKQAEEVTECEPQGNWGQAVISITAGLTTIQQAKTLCTQISDSTKNFTDSTAAFKARKYRLQIFSAYGGDKPWAECRLY